MTVDHNTKPMTIRFTKEEFEAEPEYLRADYLRQDQERKDLENALSRIGCLVKKDKLYRQEWETIKANLNRNVGIRLIIE